MRQIQVGIGNIYVQHSYYTFDKKAFKNLYIII